MTASIWYITKYIGLPSIGRGGTRSFLLMREMARLGHRCVMITSDSNHLTDPPAFAGRDLVERVDDVDICWLKTRKYEGAQSLGRMLSWLDFEWRLLRMPKRRFAKPDVVIVSSLSLFTILNGLWLKRKFGCRLVFEVRDIWPLTLIEEGGFSPRNPLIRVMGWIERLGYRRADAVIGTMPNLVQHVDEQLGDDHAPVHCVPFGIDPENLTGNQPLPSEWVERFVPKDKFIVCHAGTIGTTNALDTLISCAREMEAQDDVHFLIVGEGGLRERYERECQDLSNITFTGPVQKQMVQSVASYCDLMYFSALKSRVWQYGMSLNKVVDYMLAGKPILGSYSGFRTMVEDAAAGSVVPAGDVGKLRAEIERYLAMPREQREQIGRRGRAWMLENRTYARLADDYLRIALPDDAAV